MKSLCIDIETFSSVNLKKCGVYKYAESPDFEILLFAFSVDGGEIQVVDLASGETIPLEIIAALTDDSVLKWAHNAQFERICLSRHLIPEESYLDPTSWRCTMAWVAYMGLPLSLKEAGIVLGLEKQKLSGGNELIRYFCKPCKPTDVNGQRKRNLPVHAPDKWERFKAYNRRDVEAEMEIPRKLAKFPVPDCIWEEYRLDQEINDRGVALDMTLVRNAIAADTKSKAELTHRLWGLTYLENPNSVVQMKDWLSEKGLEVETLGKKAVTEMLKTAPNPLDEVLTLRQQLAKSSAKKYQAMENAVCSDGRARGMFRFYGANRTGRWSSKIVQLQNLPVNHMPDLAQARSLVRTGNFAALDMLYGSVPEVLSELVRTAFVPKEGSVFVVCDFASIEAVVLAWLAGETWVLDAYSAKRDLYIENAQKMFGAKDVDKRSPLRQKSKIATLSCIAEGELVLTDAGLIPIENVTTSHKVWDGVSWVSHEGVICNGFKEVIEYEGLRATPDHLVWVEGQSEPIRFELATACRAHLIQAGNGRQPLRLGKNYQPRKTMELKMEPLLCYDGVSWLRSSTVDRIELPPTWDFSRMPKLLAAASNTFVVRQTTYRREAKMQKSQGPKLSLLWRQRDSMEFPICIGGGSLDNENLSEPRSQSGNRQDKHERPLRERQYSICDKSNKSKQQTGFSIKSVGSEVLAVCLHGCDSKTVKRGNARRNIKGCGNGCNRKEEKLARYREKAKVYDIKNAGQHHRFTVSDKLVHNCGYGGSTGAIKAMGGEEMGFSEAEMKEMVTAWRAANPNIVKFWWDVDRAAKKAVKDRTGVTVRGITFYFKSGMLFITLPSGRRLCYVKPRIGTNRFGSACVTYEGVGGTKKWERLESYGPKFVENIVQATSRDLLSYVMQTLKHCPIVMTIHDEIVIETDHQMSLEAVCEQMSRIPPWAEGLPLRADGFECGFYMKN